MRLTTGVACVVALCTSSPLLGQTGDGYVGVFGDAAGTVRCMQAPPSVPTTLYVVAKTAGRTANGITGAEFRVEFTNPNGYLFNYAAPESSTVLGNPLDGTGFDIAFPSCRVPVDGVISLGAIAVFNTGGGGATTIIVKRRNPPQNPNYACALLLHCDGPAYTKSCNTAPLDSVSCLTQKAGTPRVQETDEFATFLDAYQQPAQVWGYEGFRRSDSSADWRGAEANIDTQNASVFAETRIWVGIDNGDSSAPKWIQAGYTKTTTGLQGYYEYTTAAHVTSGPQRVGSASVGDLRTYRVKKSGSLTEIYTGGVRPAPAWSEFEGAGNFDESFFGAEAFSSQDCIPGCSSNTCRIAGATLYDVNVNPSLVDFNFVCQDLHQTTASKTITGTGAFEMQDYGAGCCP